MKNTVPLSVLQTYTARSEQFPEFNTEVKRLREAELARKYVAFTDRCSQHLFLHVPLCGLLTWKYIEKTCEDLDVYKIIYSRFFRGFKVGCKQLKIKVRPAGLEPATPCLEGRGSPVRSKPGDPLHFRINERF